MKRVVTIVLSILTSFTLFGEKQIMTLTKSVARADTMTFSIFQEIAQKVKSIIIDQLGVDESEVTLEASLTTDLGADSLDTVELIMELEEKFNISIPDDDDENLTTVGQIISYLEENVK